MRIGMPQHDCTYDSNPGRRQSWRVIGMGTGPYEPYLSSFCVYIRTSIGGATAQAQAVTWTRGV